MTTPETPKHPALAVLDQEIDKRRSALGDAARAHEIMQAALDKAGADLESVLVIRDKVASALIGVAPPAAGKRERKPRRTKAEMTAAREKTAQAARDAGLVLPGGSALAESPTNRAE